MVRRTPGQECSTPDRPGQPPGARCDRHRTTGSTAGQRVDPRLRRVPRVGDRGAGDRAAPARHRPRPRPRCLADVVGRARVRAGAHRRPDPVPVGRLVDRRRGEPGRRRDHDIARTTRRWPSLAFGTPPGVVLSPQAPPCSAAPPPTCRSPRPTPSPPWIRCSARHPAAPELVGSVEGLAIAPAAEAPMQLLDAAQARAGRGLDGDRYAAGAGTFSPRADRRPGYDLTLIAAEVLDELAAAGHTLDFAGTRRNVLTRGIDVNALVGRTFRIGDVALPRPPALRALRTPRPAQRTGTAAATHPPRRPARRHPHRRRDPTRRTDPPRITCGP